MLALSIPMSASEFSYASLLERSVGCSKKNFQQSLRTGQLPHSVTSTGVGGHIEWKPEHFPHKMYDLLNDVERKGLDDIVSWLPDGKSFKIHSQIGFEQSIMPLYFSGMSSYKSFRRQLNLYGIYQHRHRPNQDANAYSHDLLVRGQRHLCDKIARKKTNPPSKSKTGSSSSKSGYGSDKSSSSSNKKRIRSSLLAMMDQRNLTSSSEPRNHRDSMVVPSLIQSNKGIDSMRRNMMIKSIYDNEMSTRPNPVDVVKLSKDTISIDRTVNTGNVFQSFMSQYWEDLPNNMSSAQVVDEIINTFQTR